LGITTIDLDLPCGARCTSTNESRDLAQIEKSKNFPFLVDVENLGTIPAREVSINFVIKINGELQPIVMDTRGTRALFPGQTLTRTNVTISSLIPSVLNNSATLEIEVEVKYKGFSDEQLFVKECAKFNPNSLSFYNTGGEYK
jgi:hypothetical protein